MQRFRNLQSAIRNSQYKALIPPVAPVQMQQFRNPQSAIRNSSNARRADGLS